MTFIPADAIFKEKFSRTTRTSTSTLSADPDLSIALPIGVWLVSASLKMDIDIGSMFKIQMTCVNCTQFNCVRWGGRFGLFPGNSPGATDSGNLWFLTNSLNASGIIDGYGSGAPDDLLPTTVEIPGEVVNVTLSNARVDISWAQSVATVTNTSMVAGSWVMARRLS